MLSIILGFLSSFAPDLLGFFKDKEANKHTLAVAKLEAQAAAGARKDELAAMVKRSELNLVEASQAAQHELDIAELEDVQSARKYDKPVGGWVDKLRASVRPVYTYAFFILYMSIKATLAYTSIKSGLPVAEVALVLWNPIDAEIFGAITGFWFGGRLREKVRS